MRTGEMLVVGSVALDSVKTPYGESVEALGGSAVFFSLAARHFGRVRLVGVVGKDFPDPHRRMLAELGVDLEGLEVASGLTFRWAGRFGKDLRDATTLSTRLNVFQDFRPTLRDSHRACPFVFLGNIDPELQMEVLGQIHSPRLVACDTHEFWIKNKRAALKELLSKVDILLINEEEARKLSREPSLLKAARVLSSWGPRIVLVKKGEHGVNLWMKGRHISLPAFPIEDVKDPTGAGDSFAGGFVGYLSRHHEWEDPGHIKRAVLTGAVLASFNVEDFGTRRLQRLALADIEDRLRIFASSLQIETPIPA